MGKLRKKAESAILITFRLNEQALLPCGHFPKGEILIFGNVITHSALSAEYSLQILRQQHSQLLN
jgi:hypothetical protein